MMKLNANEYLALDTVFEGMMDQGDKLDMVEAVKNGEYEEGGFGETSVEDIAARLKVSVKAAKGYVGSLAKKDLVWCDEEDGMILITEEGIKAWDKF